MSQENLLMTKCWNYTRLEDWETQANFLLSWADRTKHEHEWFQRWHRHQVESLPEFAGHFAWWSQWGLIPNEFFVLRSWQTDLSITDVSNKMCPRIHTDDMYQDADSSLNGIVPRYSINFPLRNCNETSTHFYKIVDTSKDSSVQYHNLEGEYGIDPTVCEEIDRYYLTEPVIMNVKVPHRVHNPLPTIREVMCFRFDNDMQLDKWMEQ
jgi:hypothetical protein